MKSFKILVKDSQKVRADVYREKKNPDTNTKYMPEGVECVWQMSMMSSKKYPRKSHNIVESHNMIVDDWTHMMDKKVASR